MQGHGTPIRDGKMRGTLHPVKLVQVVRQHPCGMQTFGKPAQHCKIVIDARQQDRLVEQGRPGLPQLLQRIAHIRSQFVAMVGMDYHRHRPRQPGQPFQKPGIDALGQDHRQTGMQAQALQLRHGLQGIGQLRQFRGRQGQRIAAGQDDFMNADIIAQIIDGFLPLACGGRFFGIGEVAPETVSAIDRAGAGRDQQCAAPVLMQYPGRAPGRQITHGIDAVAGRQGFFLGKRQNLPQERVMDVAMAHFGGETARNPEGECVSGLD